LSSKILGSDERNGLIAVEMTHTRETLTGLARMQCDLFRGKEQVLRVVISLALIGFGTVSMPNWWSYLLMAVGGCHLTAKYVSANHSANKLISAIEASGQGYPSTRLEFYRDGFAVFALPDHGKEAGPIPYEEIRAVGEDSGNYYIFRDVRGGWVVPRSALGDREKEWRERIETGTGKRIHMPKIPGKELAVRLHNRR